MLNDTINSAFNKLKNYCEKEKYKGYDPYDGLTSEMIYRNKLIKENKIIKLIWIQFFKKSPVNFRKVVGIKKEYNAKGLAIFLSSYCKLYEQDHSIEYLEKINHLTEELMLLKTDGYAGYCWGYNFDWQSKAFFLPKGTPTIVTSSFIANSILDAYDITKEERLLKISRSTCDFILNNLNKLEETTTSFSLSYSPIDKSIVFNASMLGAKLLARIYSLTSEIHLKEKAKKLIEFCCNHQNENGSWYYGKQKHHKWIDNFHTGYMIECLADYITYTKDNQYEEQLNRGFDFYINNFFTKKGIVKYYYNKTYPIDMHAVAQLTITLSKVKKIAQYQDLIETVFLWSIKNMQSKKGYFYYQKNKFYKNKISYIRWTQSWMFYSLTIYLNHMYNISNKKKYHENMV